MLDPFDSPLTVPSWDHATCLQAPRISSDVSWTRAPFRSCTRSWPAGARARRECGQAQQGMQSGRAIVSPARPPHGRAGDAALASSPVEPGQLGDNGGEGGAGGPLREAGLHPGLSTRPLLARVPLTIRATGRQKRPSLVPLEPHTACAVDALLDVEQDLHGPWSPRAPSALVLHRAVALPSAHIFDTLRIRKPDRRDIFAGRALRAAFGSHCLMALCACAAVPADLLHPSPHQLRRGRDSREDGDTKGMFAEQRGVGGLRRGTASSAGMLRQQLRFGWVFCDSHSMQHELSGMGCKD